MRAERCPVLDRQRREMRVGRQVAARAERSQQVAAARPRGETWVDDRGKPAWASHESTTSRACSTPHGEPNLCRLVVSRMNPTRATQAKATVSGPDNASSSHFFAGSCCGVNASYAYTNR